MKKLSMKKVLLLSMLTAGIVPVVIVSIVIQWQATHSLEDLTYKKLDSLQTSKKAHVEEYIQSITDGNETLSNNLMVVDAMQDFRAAFDELSKNIGIVTNENNEIKESVKDYYTNYFAKEYEARNGTSISTNPLIPENDVSIYAQYLYISNNENPLGQKEELNYANDPSWYTEMHEKYHPTMREYLRKFGYYDIFLVEPENGYIVYSVFKELDFATSLFNGPYRDTNFADVVRSAIDSVDRKPTIVDFASYTPSYDAPASFVANPIYADNKLIGVLVFQMPVDRINSIMIQSVGLGESGETILVGEDGTARSQSRFEMENTILTKKIESQGIELALNGENGSISEDINGQSYLTSYAQAEIEGINWAIIARVNSNEAFASIADLQKSSVILAAIASLLVAVCAWFLGSGFHRRLGADPVDIQRIAETIGSGELSCSDTTDKNVGAYAALVNMRVRLHEIIAESKDIAQVVRTGANELSQGNLGLSERTDQQAANLEETASSTEELASTVKQNADNARTAAKLARETTERANTGGNIASNAVTAMHEISSSSDKISNIISVIDEIAFQTNLLALNAAVEAARAGEQGRGFAVVATEVRQLAGRSASAAKEIKDLIEDSVSKVKDGTKLVQDSGTELDSIVKSVNELSDIVIQISNASEEQSAGIDQINKAVIHMDSTTQQNAALVEEAAATSESMSKQARELADCISYFKTDSSEISDTEKPDDESDNNSVDQEDMPIERRKSDRPWQSNKANHPPVERPSEAPIQRAGSGDDYWEDF